MVEGLLVLLIALLTVWATAALYFDFPFPSLRLPLAVTYIAAVICALTFLPLRWTACWIVGGCFLLVLVWWRSLRPSDDRPWQPDVARKPWAEIDDNRVTIHNLRNCDYRAETDYTCYWETRGFDLAKLRGIDVFLTYWGSPWIAHPIISFDFGDGEYLPISIEVRKQAGESYSAIRGFFRQYELIYIMSDERDLIRLRSNFRTGEDVYLFRTNASPGQAREILLEYLKRVNQMRDHPEWYNALTNNCTTNISVHAADARGALPRWDWRILLNGYSDRMMYERGDLAGNLPYSELKQRAFINPAAKAANNATDFSERIRVGRPGFP